MDEGKNHTDQMYREQQLLHEYRKSKTWVNSQLDACSCNCNLLLAYPHFPFWGMQVTLYFSMELWIFILFDAGS